MVCVCVCVNERVRAALNGAKAEGAVEIRWGGRGLYQEAL